MSGEKLNEAINLLAEYAAANLPTGYEVALVLRSDKCWLELQHDDDGVIPVVLSTESPFFEACYTADEYDKKYRGECRER